MRYDIFLLKQVKQWILYLGITNKLLFNPSISQIVLINCFRYLMVIILFQILMRRFCGEIIFIRLGWPNVHYCLKVISVTNKFKLITFSSLKVITYNLKLIIYNLKMINWEIHKLYELVWNVLIQDKLKFKF